MKVNRRPRRSATVVHVLYINAGLLLAILVALLMRGNGPGLSSTAYGAPQMAPIAGGGGVFLMPAQFSVNTWGCYLMDIDSQNICAYQYYPGEHQLKFVAARNYREDRKVKDWNTSPPPAEVAHFNDLGSSAVRGLTPAGPPEVTPAGSDLVPAPSRDFINPNTQPAAEGLGTTEKSGTTLPAEWPRIGEDKTSQPNVPTQPNIPNQPVSRPGH